MAGADLDPRATKKRVLQSGARTRRQFEVAPVFVWLTRQRTAAMPGSIYGVRVRVFGFLEIIAVALLMLSAFTVSTQHAYNPVMSWILGGPAALWLVSGL
jgi:hypothetical protein